MSRNKTTMDRKRLATFRRRLEKEHAELSALLEKTEIERRGLGGKKRGDEGEEAALSYHRDILHSQSHTESSQLRLVVDALVRLDHEEFGICEECEEPISLKRLEAVPWTPYCRDCQEEVESETGMPGER